MFTLGNKEAIVNSPLQFPFTPAAATPGALLNIKGFGTFDPTKITLASARRYSAHKLEKMAITCPTTTALGIPTTSVNVPVTVNIRMYSRRQASETTIDFIKKGRPLVIELYLNGNSSAATVATALNAAITELKYKFANLIIPFTSALNGNDVELTGTAGYYTFGENVTFTIRGAALPYTAVTTKNFDTTLTVNDASPTGNPLILSALTGLSVGETLFFQSSSTVGYKITDFTATGVNLSPAIAAGVTNGDTIKKANIAVEEVGGGLSLEEEVRMSDQFTSDAFAINANQVPIIGGKYTQVSWSMDVPTVSTGWTTHKDQGATGASISNQTFTMFFNEDNSLATNGQVDLLLQWLDGSSGSITLADFKKANGGSTLTATSDFIA